MRMMASMSEDRKPEPPDPIEDVRKGLGLLFRAAKSALESLPTGKVEEVVLTGAREVGRALENVTHTIDKQFFRRDAGDRPDRADHSSHETGSGSHAEPAQASSERPKSEPPPAPPAKDEPRGPRVE
jgi:hypothetical protein